MALARCSWRATQGAPIAAPRRPPRSPSPKAPAAPRAESDRAALHHTGGVVEIWGTLYEESDIRTVRGSNSAPMLPGLHGSDRPCTRSAASGSVRHPRARSARLRRPRPWATFRRAGTESNESRSFAAARSPQTLYGQARARFRPPGCRAGFYALWCDAVCSGALGSWRSWPPWRSWRLSWKSL